MRTVKGIPNLEEEEVINGISYGRNDIIMIYIDQGKTLRQMAEYLGCSVKRAYKLISRFSLPGKYGELTPQNLRVLRFIIAFYKKNNYSPYLKEISVLLGINVACVHHHLKHLEKEGYLSFSPHKRRSIKLTEKARRWCTSAHAFDLSSLEKDG